MSFARSCVILWYLSRGKQDLSPISLCNLSSPDNFCLLIRVGAVFPNELNSVKITTKCLLACRRFNDKDLPGYPEGDVTNAHGNSGVICKTPAKAALTQVTIEECDNRIAWLYVLCRVTCHGWTLNAKGQQRKRQSQTLSKGIYRT